MKTFEVEIKFRVENAAELERQLQQLGGTGFGELATELDSFFQHPCRDFAQTDECLRLRKRVLPDGTLEHSLTYKGPKIDSTTKTRQEIEIPVAEPEQWESLLVALGFHLSASVQKFRRRQKLTRNGRNVEIVLDTLPALPESGRLFVEMETMASEEEVDECRSLLLDIAQQLGLSEPIRESYLKLQSGND
ncbi:MAG: class IV adenylate cyclase [Planctomycetaceae bacterium]|jgi:adenylate cyclase class 2|nr:class IV adenylate cyclase [Planctomycetaceae bacterium]